MKKIKLILAVVLVSLLACPLLACGEKNPTMEEIAGTYFVWMYNEEQGDCVYTANYLDKGAISIVINSDGSGKVIEYYDGDSGEVEAAFALDDHKIVMTLTFIDPDYPDDADTSELGGLVKDDVIILDMGSGIGYFTKDDTTCPLKKYDNVIYGFGFDGNYLVTAAEDGQSLTIRSKIDGISVTTISRYSFAYNDSLESVTIPSGVKTIEWCAFYECGNLKTINFEGTKAQWETIEKQRDWDMETGEVTVHCSDGDVTKEANRYEYGEDVHAHTIMHYTEAAAECETDGYIEHYICSTCGKIYIDEEYTIEVSEEDVIIPATGHSYSTEWGFDGEHHYHSSNCGHALEEIDVAEHTYDDDDVCTVCGYEACYDPVIKEIAGTYYPWIYDGKDDYVLDKSDYLIINIDGSGTISLNGNTVNAYINSDGDSINVSTNTPPLGLNGFIKDGVLILRAYIGDLRHYTKEDAQCPHIKYDSVIYGYGFDGTYCVLRASSDAVSVTIGAEIDGISVTTIWMNAFTNCGNLESIVIPTSITKIETFAFLGLSPSIYIRYNGTKARWQAIQKKQIWGDGGEIYIIHCSDGDLEEEAVLETSPGVSFGS